MKNSVQIYRDADNGISLRIIPETDQEEELLLGLWRHGKLELVHPGESKGKRGYAITWRFKPEED